MTYKLGLIGAGKWGRNYIRAIRDIQHIELICVSSQNPNTKDLVEDKCYIYSDWTQVATDSNLDGIIISTPPALHYSMARLALENSINVLVEKPFTTNLYDASRLCELAESLCLSIKVGHVHLYSESFKALMEISPQLGKINRLHSSAGNNGPYRQDISVLWDWAPHDISMLLSLLKSRPRAVFAQLIASNDLVEGYAQAIQLSLDFDCNIKAIIDLSNLIERKKRWFKVEQDDQATNKLIKSDYIKSEAVKLSCLQDPLSHMVNGFCESLDVFPEARIANLQFELMVIETICRSEKSLLTGKRE